MLLASNALLLVMLLRRRQRKADEVWAAQQTAPVEEQPAAEPVHAVLPEVASEAPGAEAPAAPEPAPAHERLRVIQASVGQTLRLVPVDEVLFFEAADKYVRVVTPGHEYLIRTPLKELLPQLDAQVFWQVHRGSLVRASAIEHVTRDEAGKTWLSLRGRPQRLAVSRLYAHLFKPM